MFRGSDVKDLRIEESPKETKPPVPPQVPNDPAILGVCLFTVEIAKESSSHHPFNDEKFRM